MVDVYEFNCDPDSQAELVEIHYDFLCQLLQKRCMSLTAIYLLPPIRYCGVLDPATCPL